MRGWGYLLLTISLEVCSASQVYCHDVLHLMGLMAYRAQHQSELNPRYLRSVERRIRDLKKRTGLNRHVDVPEEKLTLDNLLTSLKVSLAEDVVDTEQEATRLTAGILRRMLAEKQIQEETDIVLRLIQSGLTNTNEQILAVMLSRSDIVDVDSWLGAPPTEANRLAIARFLAQKPDDALASLRILPSQSQLQSAAEIAGYEIVEALANYHLAMDGEVIIRDLERQLPRASIYATETFGRYLHWYLLQKSPLAQISSVPTLRRYLGVN